MRVVFAGTPEVAVPALEAIAASSHELVGVVTRPDAPAGRGRGLVRSPVGAWADERGVEVLTPARPREQGWRPRRAGARRAWRVIATALANSGDAGDRQLAAAINSYANGMERTGQSTREDIGLDPLMRPSVPAGRSR